jgi:hypothetical protein
MGEEFRNKSAVSKLAVVKKMVDAAKPVTEAVGDDEPEKPEKPEDETEQPDMVGGMPADEELPLEVEDIAETAVRALLEDPDVIRHALQDTPYKTDAQHYREVYKMVKSRLFY